MTATPGPMIWQKPRDDGETEDDGESEDDGEAEDDGETDVSDCKEEGRNLGIASQ